MRGLILTSSMGKTVVYLRLLLSSAVCSGMLAGRDLVVLDLERHQRLGKLKGSDH